MPKSKVVAFTTVARYRSGLWVTSGYPDASENCPLHQRCKDYQWTA
jgi:hypothetical protein